MDRILRKLRNLAGCGGLVVLGWLGAQAGPAVLAQMNPGTPTARTTASAEEDKAVVAYVNGVPITRRELADELIARRGKEQLQLLINRKVIEHAAKERNLVATEQEVEEDLRKVMKISNCETFQDFERRVLRERHTNLLEYKEDVVRPGILMKKLAAERAKPTDEEIQKAFEANYGDKVDVRVIIEKNKNAAFDFHKRLHGKSVDEFIRAAQEQADNRLSAVGGKVRPVNRYSSLDNVEKEAFRLKDGEVGQVLETPEGFVILFREKLIPGLPEKERAKKFAEVRQDLIDDISQKKLARETPRLFKELRDKAVVRDYLNNTYDILEVMQNWKGTPAHTSAPVPLPKENPE